MKSPHLLTDAVTLLGLCFLLAACIGWGCQDPVAGSGKPPAAATPEGVKDLATLTQERDELKKQLAEKEAEVRTARVEQRQHYCRWFCVALGLLSLALGAGAYFLPLAKLKLAVAAVLTAGLIPVVLLISSVAAYWEVIGAVTLAAGVLALIIWWHNDHTALRQVVMGVEEFKKEASDGWQALKPHLQTATDEGVKDTVGKFKTWAKGAIRKAAYRA
jgi:hypothetical protein